MFEIAILDKNRDVVDVFYAEYGKEITWVAPYDIEIYGFQKLENGTYEVMNVRGHTPQGNYLEGDRLTITINKH